MDENTAITPAPEDITTATEAAAAEYPWEQRDGEPWMWYQRFIQYFLPQGPGRSIYKAYELMVATEHPDVAKAREEASKLKSTATTNWSKKATEWDWRERSKAFDRFTYKAAQANVDSARIILLDSAAEAARALKSALANPRLQVAAAKEILDRVGLPGTVNVGVSAVEKFTADELKAAEEEVDVWERQTLTPKPTSD